MTAVYPEEESGERQDGLGRAGLPSVHVSGLQGRSHRAVTK